MNSDNNLCKMDEKFCLKWNDFHLNVSNTFQSLRSQEDFQDVTLVGDDNTQISAHKVVLSSCSEYFKNILIKNKHSHPLICLERTGISDLRNMLDYMYNGEVKIYQDDIDNFLKVAQRFKLEGLMATEQGNDERINDDKIKMNLENDTYIDTVTWIDNVNEKQELSVEKKIISSSSEERENLEQLDSRVNASFDKIDGSFVCKFCSKSFNKVFNVKEHVEIHFDGLSFPCDKCEKTFRSRKILRNHKNRYHKNI